ncbi:MAG TPA: CdaR family protein [Chloroflexia bacterium]|nr:CdaR family protein [Chloroflexia bacterium]
MKAQTTESDSQSDAEPAVEHIDGLTESVGFGRADIAMSTNGVDAPDALPNAEAGGNTVTSTVEPDPAQIILGTTATANASATPAPTREAERKPSLLARIASIMPSVGLDDRAGRALLSILLAFLLWFYVVNLENPSQTTVFNDLPVEVRGLGKGLKLIGSISPVDVTVQAPQSVLALLRPAEIHPYIDLAGFSAGVRTVPIRTDVRGTQASNVSSVSLGPSSAQVQIEVEASREFPIQVQVTGTPAFGYGFDTAQAEPNIVTVTGPEDLVARVSKVIASVNVDEKAGTQRGSRPPIAVDENGSEVAGLTFDPAQVQVVVPIKLRFNYRVVGVRADTRGQPAPGYRVSAITTDPNTVTICCKPDVLDVIQFLDTLPVSISGATFNVITRTELLLPPEVELYPGQTKTISVTVNVEPLITTLQVSVAPIVEGQPDGASVIVSPDRLDLTLAGTFDQLQGLKPTDVRAFLSVEGRGPGTYEVRPQVIVPQGVKLERTTPELVTVTLVAPTPVPTSTPTVAPTSIPQPTATPPAPAGPVSTVDAPRTNTTPSIAPMAAPTGTPRATQTANP